MASGIDFPCPWMTVRTTDNRSFRLPASVSVTPRADGKTDDIKFFHRITDQNHPLVGSAITEIDVWDEMLELHILHHKCWMLVPNPISETSNFAEIVSGFWMQ